MCRFLAILVSSALLPQSAQASRAQHGERAPVWRTAPAVVESTHDVAWREPSTAGVRPESVPLHALDRNHRLPSRGVSGAPASAPFGGLAVGGEEPLTPPTGFPGISQTPWRPPDPTIAVGPAHVVETVNMQLAFYTKSGTLQFAQNLDSTGDPGFFESVGGGNFCFDPKCLYDPHSGRFVVLALERYVATEEGYIDIAVSDDSDPNGTWFKYRTDDVTNVSGIDFWVDYPGLGVDEHALYVTGDLFDFSDTFRGGVKYRVFDKAPLLVGAPALYADLLDTGSASVQCTLAFGSGFQPFCVSVASTSAIRLQAIDDPLGTPSLVTQDVAVPPFALPVRFVDTVPNLSGCGIDALDGRIMNATLRGGSLLTTHAVKSAGKIVARWYEFALGSWPASGVPSLVQSGSINAGGSVHTWFPAIVDNGCGEVGVILARSSATEFAGIAYTGRRAGDALGTMTIPLTTLATGTSGYCDFRWGDYFGIALDPSDGRTFWGVGEYAVGSATWQTWIASFSLDRAPLFDPPSPCGGSFAVEPGTPVTFVLSASDPDACDTVTLSVAGAPPGALHAPVLPQAGAAPSTTFSWTPGIHDGGPHVVTYSASDGSLAATCKVTIYVKSKVRRHPGL
jgi:hypothetical protein